MNDKILPLIFFPEKNIYQISINEIKNNNQISFFEDFILVLMILEKEEGNKCTNIY